MHTCQTNRGHRHEKLGRPQEPHMMDEHRVNGVLIVDRVHLCFERLEFLASEIHWTSIGEHVPDLIKRNSRYCFDLLRKACAHKRQFIALLLAALRAHNLLRTVEHTHRTNLACVDLFFDTEILFDFTQAPQTRKALATEIEHRHKYTSTGGGQQPNLSKPQFLKKMAPAILSTTSVSDHNLPEQMVSASQYFLSTFRLNGFRSKYAPRDIFHLNIARAGCPNIMIFPHEVFKSCPSKVISRHSLFGS